VLLPDIKALVECSLRHTSDGAPEIQRVGDVRTDATEDEEDEIDRVSENCGWGSVQLVGAATEMKIHTGYYLVPAQGEEQAVKVQGDLGHAANRATFGFYVDPVCGLLEPDEQVGLLGVADDGHLFL
jgi:hypothetical protein